MSWRNARIRGRAVQTANINPGIYTVEATYVGLHTENKITVEDGAEIEIVLQLKLPDLETPPKP